MAAISSSACYTTIPPETLGPRGQELHDRSPGGHGVGGQKTAPGGDGPRPHRLATADEHALPRLELGRRKLPYRIRRELVPQGQGLEVRLGFFFPKHPGYGLRKDVL